MDERIDQIIEEVVSEKAEQLTDPQKKRLKSVVKEFFETGKPIGEILNFSPDTLESFYSHAYFLYQSAKYGAARHIFQLLIYISPEEPKYYLGLAASLHRMKVYPYAVMMYTFAATFDPINPMSLYYASDCFIELEEWDKAMESLQNVIKRCEGKPVFSIVADRSRMTLEKLKIDHPNLTVTPPLPQLDGVPKEQPATKK